MRRIWHFTLGDERGAVFIASVVLVTIMTILGIALFDLSMLEGGLAIGDAASNQLLYCAEAALGRTMLDYYAGGNTTAQINTALLTADTRAPLNTSPNTTSVTTSSPGALTCSYTVTFTSAHQPTDCPGGVAGAPLTCGQLQATATANGIQRSVRIQLLNLSWQFWNSADLNGQKGPYWDGQKNGGTGSNIGNYFLKSAGYGTCALPNCIPGPGRALPFWGQPYAQTPDTNSSITPPNPDYDYCAANNCGMAASSILFKGGGGGNVTLMNKNTAYTPTDPKAVNWGYRNDQMGWFESDATGSVPSNGCPSDSKCHSFTTVQNTGNSSAQFTPTTNYYGFYMMSARGYTYYTLANAAANKTPALCSSNPSDASCAPWIGNQFTPSPADCGRTADGQASCSVIPFQHFTVFQENATTYWIGVDDLWNLGVGPKCVDGVSTKATSCIPRSILDCVSLANPIGCSSYSYLLDGDYSDWVLKFVTSSGDTVATPGVDSRRWKDWQECSGPQAGTPPQPTC